ncbi:hypothetical protein JB92DRAFT_124352 [Gautieria morchelliformis]|nr:hypothetical protein JB92DRAFT_124352 [Gautieria morchelliformis]
MRYSHPPSPHPLPSNRSLTLHSTMPPSPATYTHSPVGSKQSPVIWGARGARGGDGSLDLTTLGGCGAGGSTATGNGDGGHDSCGISRCIPRLLGGVMRITDRGSAALVSGAVPIPTTQLRGRGRALGTSVMGPGPTAASSRGMGSPSASKYSMTPSSVRWLLARGSDGLPVRQGVGFPQASWLRSLLSLLLEWLFPPSRVPRSSKLTA